MKWSCMSDPLALGIPLWECGLSANAGLELALAGAIKSNLADQAR
jgi:hypothetical protein